MAGYSGVRVFIGMYHVYILKSLKDGRLYIGQTNALAGRFEYHNRGRVKSTKNRRPFTLLVAKEFATRAEVVKMERYLKSLKKGNEFKRILTHWGVAKW